MLPMIKRLYSFGGVVFSIESPVSLGLDSRLEAFSIPYAKKIDFTYRIIPCADSESNFQISRQGDLLKVNIREDLIDKIVLGNLLSNASGAYLLNERRRFILHASYVLVNGEAILFTAASQTGKSTQANYWKQAKKAEIVNEDRAIISWENGQYYANGCWAMGSAAICKNCSVPIRAIVLLGQGKENSCRIPAPKEILTHLLPQTTFDQSNPFARIGIVDMVSEMIGKVPIVAYDCIHHVSAVEALERYI